MKRYIGLSFVWLMLLAVLPVQAQRPTRTRQFPKMYEEKPASIVIMPPINRTNFVEAKEYFYTTLYVPLCEKGYYVFSPYLTMELFRSESAYDSELYFDGNLAPFREVTGADAAMFTIVKQWDRDNLNGKLRVRAEFILRSTKTNETLYHREGLVTLDTEVDSEGDKPIGVLTDVLITALGTAMQDKVKAGRRCSGIVLSDMPIGPYSPRYGADGNEPAGASYVEVVE